MEVEAFPDQLASRITGVSGDRFVDASRRLTNPDRPLVGLDQVRRVAEDEFALGALGGATAEFYLVQWWPGEEGIRFLEPGQLVWLVDVDGFTISGEGVAGGPPPPVVRHKYIYIDAVTGAPLGSLETE